VREPQLIVTDPIEKRAGGLLALAVTAIGVVYGDIGTSPLYAIRECFHGLHSVPPTHDNVLGVLSLIIYALLIVVSVKYTMVVMRADNQGEGGILALTALVPTASGSGSAAAHSEVTRPILIGLGIFGAALLYGDGMITPAISVLGAVEGLEVAAPSLSSYVVPLAVAILVCLFLFQRFGTHRVGGLFGPVMIMWFITISLLGLVWVVRAPAVFEAFNPAYAVAFFRANGLVGFTVLGTVFLVVTGGEALYADMGHFGKRPIRYAWFAFVLPALLMNYFGQGALLLQNPAAAEQPFFMLAPGWGQLPLLVIATIAASIASQALISGAFSLTRQAIQLGYAPRFDVQHTSSHEAGQVYVPQVNWALAVCTILIVIGFRSSGSLAAAYGIAVTMTMVITTILLHVVATERWKWPSWMALFLTSIFLFVDLAFFGANLVKVEHGGWLPLIVGATIFTLMTTWKTGRRIVADRMRAHTKPLDAFIGFIMKTPPIRVPGTAVFMTAQLRGTPPALVHNLQCNKILHERVIVLTVTTAQMPYVKGPGRVAAIEALGHGIYYVHFQYGFMDDPNVPETLLSLQQGVLDVDPSELTYFLGRETLLVTQRPGMAMWREKLFVLMTKNALRATAYFRLPVDRVVELGVQVEI
jgi:KUP system potassium uptake protein